MEVGVARRRWIVLGAAGTLLVRGAILNFGTMRIWWDEDLAHAESDLITRWRVHYRFAADGQWSSVVSQEIDTLNETCLADADFDLTVE